MNESSASDSYALGRHHQLLGKANWPNEISLMASRKWTNIPIKEMHYEVQSSFYSDNLSDLDHLTASVFIKLFNDDTFITWLTEVCNKFVAGTIVESWFSEQEFTQQLSRQLQMNITAIWSLPSADPGPADHTSFHIGMIISSM